MIEQLAEMPRYEAYKDSGVEWLREIPEHWNSKKIKFLFYIGRGRVISQQELDELGSYPVYSSQTKDNGILGYINSFDFDCSQITWTTDGANAGTVFLRHGKHNCTNVCGTLQPKNSGFSIEFISHGLSVAAQYYKRPDTNGAKIMNGEMAEIFVPLPPITEQTAIAAYLNRKTAHIDQAVAIKEQQIALLKEHKQILIQNAVTRGLDTNVPMRDSGVEWIGEIPVHWIVVSKMKYISSLKGRQGWQGLKAEEYRDEGPYVLSSAHFNNYIISWEKCPRVSVERYLMDENIQLQIGDILLMKDGANMGKLAFVDDMPGLACLNSHLLLFRPLQKGEAIFYNPKFMFYHMLIDRFQDYVKVNGTGSTFLGISQESIGNYPICLPTLDEQAAIVTHIETQSAKIDQAIAIQQQQIDKLKEYKATLINSAVTGKIKVPTAVASKDASS